MKLFKSSKFQFLRQEKFDSGDNLPKWILLAYLSLAIGWEFSKWYTAKSRSCKSDLLHTPQPGLRLLHPKLRKQTPKNKVMCTNGAICC